MTCLRQSTASFSQGSPRTTHAGPLLLWEDERRGRSQVRLPLQELVAGLEILVEGPLGDVAVHVVKTERVGCAKGHFPGPGPFDVPAKWANSASRKRGVVPVGVGGGRPGPAGVYAPPASVGRRYSTP